MRWMSTWSTVETPDTSADVYTNDVMLTITTDISTVVVCVYIGLHDMKLSASSTRPNDGDRPVVLYTHKTHQSECHPSFLYRRQLKTQTGSFTQSLDISFNQFYCNCIAISNQ